MALPAIEYYGVDLVSFIARWFPTGLAGTREQTLAQACLDQAANDLQILVRAARYEPADIKQGSAPLAYRWLQETLMQMASLGFLEASNAAFDLADRRAAVESRLQQIRTQQHVVLADAPGARVVNAGASKLCPR